MRRRRWLWVQLLVGAILVGVVALVLAANSQPEKTPHRLGSLNRVDVIAGEEALRRVRQLHGKDVGISEAYIAFYQGNGARVVVWAAEAGSEDAAQRLVLRMTERIGAGNPVFSTPQTLRVGSRTVYRTFGDGADNFYYRKGSQVFWLTIAGADAEAILSEAIRTMS